MSDVTIYAYFRSSCSARIRIALEIKGLTYDYIPVNLLKNEQLSEEHRSINPSASVPLLVIRNSTDPNQLLRIGQSVAALEYLEEAYPDKTKLLPASLDGRATVRALVNIISADTQPPTNLRIMRRVKELNGKPEEWNREIMLAGLQAYEAVCAQHAGKYSYGDELTLADVVLIPAVWNARRFGVEFLEVPTVNRIMENLEALPVIQKSSYFRQPDTPADLRE